VKASAWEFRHRFWFPLVILALGFTTPWDAVWHVDPRGINGDVWGWLAVALSRSGAISISTAFDVVLVAAIVGAVAGAWLRIWGSAYLGTDVMSDASMRSDAVIADGPYRYMRNPLYLGSWLNAVALALLMRPSGAVFMLVALVGFHMRLILAEEAFLKTKLGDTYTAYCAAVPRIFPALRPQVTAGGTRARWDQAVVAEVYMWLSAASFAVLGWRYDARLLLQSVLVSFGVALVVKGWRMGREEKTR
jgi:protein-S-isoprenylcysteine O-methyltransferase Ste14